MNHEWVRQQFPQLENLVPLAQGGQKVVYQGNHAEYGPSVLKLIRPGNLRVERELEAVRRVESAHVPAVYDAGVTTTDMGDLAWLVEAFIPGQLLRQRLAQGPLQRAEILRLAVELTGAAADAEKMGVVHRDIKPENIILGVDGATWLLDFGIARIRDLPSMTPTAAPYGPCTPGYAAPEQFRNRKNEIDGRADLFSIGVVLHEAASGRNVFRHEAKSDQEIFHRTERAPLPPLNLSWDKGTEFEAFVRTLTQKYRAQRPRTCADASRWAREVAQAPGA